MIKVLVITYNQENYISQTLDSIIRQKVDVPFTIVIADDCSTDNTRLVCEKYHSRYPEMIKLVSRPHNLGLVKNFFSLLMDESDCDYYALCAGDDYWIDEYKLQKQYNYLETHKDCSVVITGFQKLYVNTGEYSATENWNSELLNNCGKNAIPFVLNESFSSFPVASSSFFRSKEVAEVLKECEVLFRSKQLPGEGMIFFSILALLGKYAFIKDLTTVYRVQELSACHFEDNGKKQLFQLKYLIQKMDVADFWDLNLFYKLKQLFHSCVTSIYYIKEGNKEDIVSFLSYARSQNYRKRTKTGINIMLFFSRNMHLTSTIYSFLSMRKKIIAK